MALRFGLQLLIDNIGMSFEWIVLLGLVLGALIIASRSVMIALIILFVTSGAVFVWFYNVGFNFAYPLVVFFMSLIALAFTLYVTDTTSRTGGFTG